MSDQETYWTFAPADLAGLSPAMAAYVEEWVQPHLREIVEDYVRNGFCYLEGVEVCFTPAEPMDFVEVRRSLAGFLSDGLGWYRTTSGAVPHGDRQAVSAIRAILVSTIQKIDDALALPSPAPPPD